MGIDEVGIDKVGIDEVGINRERLLAFDSLWTGLVKRPSTISEELKRGVENVY